MTLLYVGVKVGLLLSKKEPRLRKFDSRMLKIMFVPQEGGSSRRRKSHEKKSEFREDLGVGER